MRLHHRRGHTCRHSDEKSPKRCRGWFEIAEKSALNLVVKAITLLTEVAPLFRGLRMRRARQGWRIYIMRNAIQPSEDTAATEGRWRGKRRLKMDRDRDFRSRLIIIILWRNADGGCAAQQLLSRQHMARFQTPAKMETKRR